MLRVIEPVKDGVDPHQEILHQIHPGCLCCLPLRDHLAAVLHGFWAVVVPRALQRLKIQYGLHDTNQACLDGRGCGIFRDREISQIGTTVVVRPNYYVACMFTPVACAEVNGF